LGKNRVLAFAFKSSQTKKEESALKIESSPVKDWKRITFADYPIKGIHQESER